MDDESVFYEKQKFNQWWLWIILLGLSALFIFGSYQQIVMGHVFGDKPMSNLGLMTITASVLLLPLLFYFSKLETRITKEGIYVRFFPYHLKFKFFPWDSISQCYVRQYSALTEFGGWGLRRGLFGAGRAFNVSGNKGMQLMFNEGNKLLVGTAKSEELTQALLSIGKLID
ncbi:MAG: DUF6141 family protein [bacterium]|nr:DUF6141 family protein [bacterium]